MKFCNRKKINNIENKIYDEIKNKGYEIFSQQDRDREGYTIITIAFYDNKIYELRNCCGDKSISEIIMPKN